MTIEHLLRMESGFDCEEFNDGKDCETDMMASKNRVGFSLDLPTAFRHYENRADGT